MHVTTYPDAAAFLRQAQPALEASGVAELSRMLLTEGWDHCILFVEASNAAAQRLYLRVGYRPVAEFLEIALEG